MKKTLLKHNNFIKILLVLITAMFFCATAGSAPILPFSNPGNGWTQFADDDGVGSGGFVNPGWGGQAFDAEYLFFKSTATTLSIGIQTGYDMVDGHQLVSGHDYYAGDLALSFDGDISGEDGSGYDYAVDFGLYTEDYDNDMVGVSVSGIHAAGLYSVDNDGWNNDVVRSGGYDFTESIPFAMETGTLMAGALQSNTWGQEGNSYYRTVTIDISYIAEIQSGEGYSFSAHWTMSCGNDAINGNNTVSSSNVTEPVPEPGTIVLLGIGLAGLMGMYLRKKLRGKVKPENSKFECRNPKTTRVTGLSSGLQA